MTTGQAGDTPKTAIVTGGGSGIGQAFARALLAKGWRVAVIGRREDALKETLEGFGADVGLAVPTDVADVAAVAAAFEAVENAFGRVDLLFNNAGTFSGGGPIEDIDPDIWKSVVDINLSGAFYCAQAAYRLMKTQDPQGGRIINNGSIASKVPRPNSTGYTTTKHAISGLTKSIALEGRQYSITCGQIDIGNTTKALGTKMNKGVLQADGSRAPEPLMDVTHVVDGLMYMAELPLAANVLDMTIMASNMPFVGRG